MSTGNAQRWRKVIVPVVDQGEAIEITLTVPFRPVELATLAPDVLRLPILDPLHVALLVMHELLCVAATDIARSGHGPLAGRYPSLLARFYAATAGQRFRADGPDGALDPLFRRIEFTGLHAAPDAIAGAATATTLIQALSLRALAEHILGESTTAPQPLAGQLRRLAGELQVRIENRNQTLASNHHAPAGHIALAAIRQLPPGAPLLLLFPDEGPASAVHWLK